MFKACLALWYTTRYDHHKLRSTTEQIVTTGMVRSAVRYQNAEH